MGAKQCKTLSSQPSRDSESVHESYKTTNKGGTMDDTEYVEGVVCRVGDINDNEMKSFSLGDEGKILLIKQNTKLYAIGAKCTHYGAPLDAGALGEGRVRCPWHGACFNIETGDIEDYPGLYSLPSYDVEVTENDRIKVRAKRTHLKTSKRIKGTKDGFGKDEHVVIVGGGPSGATCAVSLRGEGFQGTIVLIGKETVLPYDRVKYSKTMNFDIERAQLLPQSFYSDFNIDLKLGCEAISLDTTEKVVKLSTGDTVSYSRLFICTGSKPRVPQIEGIDLKNIFTLRNHDDASAIHSQLSLSKHLVILGLGFIGMEIAAYCLGKCASVTIIGRDTVPLKSVFGETIGERIKKEYISRGAKFLFENNIKKFIPKEGMDDFVGKVELTNGDMIPADIVAIGIGSTFNTEWLKDSSIELNEDGSVVVNEYLQTNIENVYAGGDISYAPILGTNETSAAIGHYSLAQYHGKIAALNICDRKTMLKTVPFFWTMLFGRSYRYSGYGKPSEIRIYGSLQNYEFFAYYLKGDKVIAMSGVGPDPVIASFANLLYEGKTLTREQIDMNHLGWIRNRTKEFVKKFSSLIGEEIL